MSYELEFLANSKEEKTKYHIIKTIPHDFKIKEIMKENLNKDSVKFTFAFRLAIVVSFWEFIGVYFNLPDARWLACTSLAIVLPYTDNTLSKSRMRIRGTILGIIIFAILSIICFGPYNIINKVSGMTLSNVTIGTILLMIISYIYTLIKPERYDADTTFITLQAILYSFSMFPATMSMALRFAFVILGILVAIPSNYLIMPYSLLKGNINLSKRALKMNKEQIANLREALKGNFDDNENTTITLKSGFIEDKIAMNNSKDENKDIDKILEYSKEIRANCTLLRNTLRATKISNKTKSKGIQLIEESFKKNMKNEYINKLTQDLDLEEKIYIKIINNILNMSKNSENKLKHLKLTST